MELKPLVWIKKSKRMANRNLLRHKKDGQVFFPVVVGSFPMKIVGFRSKITFTVLLSCHHTNSLCIFNIFCQYLPLIMQNVVQCCAHLVVCVLIVYEVCYCRFGGKIELNFYSCMFNDVPLHGTESWLGFHTSRIRRRPWKRSERPA